MKNRCRGMMDCYPNCEECCGYCNDCYGCEEFFKMQEGEE